MAMVRLIQCARDKVGKDVETDAGTFVDELAADERVAELQRAARAASARVPLFRIVAAK
jgi:hypothetical protein